jgi:hypothetical protein
MGAAEIEAEIQANRERNERILRECGVLRLVDEIHQGGRRSARETVGSGSEYEPSGESSSENTAEDYTTDTAEDTRVDATRATGGRKTYSIPSNTIRAATHTMNTGM